MKGGVNMKNQSILYGVIGLLLGVVLTGYIASSAVNTNNSGVMNMMGIGTKIAGSKNMMAANIDRHFIEQMIPHHKDAITMAKLAQTKAQRPEIKILAEAIIKSQSKEIDQMKDWYKSWFGEEVSEDEEVMGDHGMGRGTVSIHMGMMGDETDMTRLEQAEDFDKVFIEEMIPHHQMAVMMATMLERGTNRLEMKQLAKDIKEAQTKEINQMREWYKNWGYAK